MMSFPLFFWRGEREEPVSTGMFKLTVISMKLKVTHLNRNSIELVVAVPPFYYYRTEL